MNDQKQITQFTDLELARINGQLWQQMSQVQAQLQAVGAEIDARMVKAKSELEILALTTEPLAKS